MRKKKPEPGKTQTLQPLYVVESDDEIMERHKDEIVDKQRELDRKAGAEKKHLDAQLTERDLSAIDEYRRDHPGAKRQTIAEWIHRGDPDKTIAEWMQRDPETRIILRKKGRPVLKDGKPQLLSVSALRRKIPPPQK